METRKIQQTGGSSFIITLPKEWVNTLKLKKNDIVGVEIQPDSSLLVIPDTEGRQFQKTKVLDVGKMKNSRHLTRYLIGAYEAGFTEIKLVSEKKLPLFVRTVVREFTQNTIGQEVIEEYDNTITLKDLLNPAEMPFKNTIKRMFIIIKSMHENTEKGLKNRDQKLLEMSISGDNDLDRLNWLVGRQYSIILHDPSLSKKMDIDPETASHYYLVSRIMERVGDHFVKIAENSVNLIDEKLDEKIHKKIVETIHDSEALAVDIFDASIQSLMTRDMKLANNTIDRVETLISSCEKISELALKQKGLVAVSVGYIEESIRRIGEYAANLSEIAINYLIRIEK